MQTDRLVGGADHRRADVVLDLPAPRQPVAGGPRRPTRSTRPSATCPMARPVLRAFAQAADREADGAKGTMWSYRRDFGPVRLLVIDSRCGRILADGRRSMISDAEFDWVEHQVDDGAFEHLVVGDVDALAPAARPPRHRVVERGAVRAARAAGSSPGSASGSGARSTSSTGRRSGSRSTGSRACSHGSARGEHGGPAPATICVLSGDVHHTYISEADYEPPLAVARLPDHVLADPQHDPAARCASCSTSAGARRSSGSSGSSIAGPASRRCRSTGTTRPGRISATCWRCSMLDERSPRDTAGTGGSNRGVSRA